MVQGKRARDKKESFRSIVLAKQQDHAARAKAPTSSQIAASSAKQTVVRVIWALTNTRPHPAVARWLKQNVVAPCPTRKKQLLLLPYYYTYHPNRRNYPNQHKNVTTIVEHDQVDIINVLTIQ
jgi:predicted component of type VI protein secretion system